MVTVAEPIGLRIVAVNGGSYTGAILFTGFMYIGAAVCLWLVRAWKIGDMEAEDHVGSLGGMEVEGHVGDLGDSGSFRKSRFAKRLFTWRRV